MLHEGTVDTVSRSYLVWLITRRFVGKASCHDGEPGVTRRLFVVSTTQASHPSLRDPWPCARMVGSFFNDPRPDRARVLHDHSGLSFRVLV